MLLPRRLGSGRAVAVGGEAADGGAVVATLSTSYDGGPSPLDDAGVVLTLTVAPPWGSSSELQRPSPAPSDRARGPTGHRPRRRHREAPPRCAENARGAAFAGPAGRARPPPGAVGEVTCRTVTHGSSPLRLSARSVRPLAAPRIGDSPRDRPICILRTQGTTPRRAVSRAPSVTADADDNRWRPRHRVRAPTGWEGGLADAQSSEGPAAEAAIAPPIGGVSRSAEYRTRPAPATTSSSPAMARFNLLSRPGRDPRYLPTGVRERKTPQRNLNFFVAFGSAAHQ